MDDQENEQLQDIHEEVKGSHAQLGAINERTRNIEASLENINEDIDHHSEKIDNLEREVKRNTTIINAVTVGLSGFVVWVAEKLGRINIL